MKFAYIVPDFANPTDETLSRAGRQHLLALARNLDIPIIEDTAYEALRFEGEEIASLQALDVAETGTIEASRVIYTGTFSKTLTPGLRIGWICASQALIRRLVLIKQASDLNSSAINQSVILALAENTYDSLVRQAREHYRRKRDVMLAALSEHMPDGTTWTHPQDGLYIWVTLPPGIDAARLLPRSVTEASVAFVPGQAFFAVGSRANTIRLSFSLPDEASIVQGIERLARLVTQSLL